MIDYTNFNWGPTSEWYKEQITKEMFEENIYEKCFPVEEGDIVVDFGASIGDFIWSIKNKNPKHCFVIEPLNSYFDILQENLLGYPVSFTKAFLSQKETTKVDWDGLTSECRSLTFEQFIKENNLKYINFLKTDCEGGEYSIFTKENLEYITNHIKKISGEWHLSTPELKQQFKNFRDNYLIKFNNFEVYSVDGINIKWDLWNEHFIEYYNEVLIYIDNR
jgi:FkbM family methyltransferase